MSLNFTDDNAINLLHVQLNLLRIEYDYLRWFSDVTPEIKTRSNILSNQIEYLEKCVAGGRE